MITPHRSQFFIFFSHKKAAGVMGTRLHSAHDFRMPKTKILPLRSLAESVGHLHEFVKSYLLVEVVQVHAEVFEFSEKFFNVFQRIEVFIFH
jgi:hypothetical protein